MRRLRMLLSVATVFWVVALSAPAGGRPRAVGPTISASPSTGLIGQQPVEVTGQNWGTNVLVGIFTAYLDYDGTTLGNVYLGPVTDVTTASDGSFSQSVKVKRVIGGHDCAKLVDPNDKCELVAADKPDANTIVELDITFAPK